MKCYEHSDVDQPYFNRSREMFSRLNNSIFNFEMAGCKSVKPDRLFSNIRTSTKRHVSFRNFTNCYNFELYTQMAYKELKFCHLQIPFNS